MVGSIFHDLLAPRPMPPALKMCCSPTIPPQHVSKQITQACRIHKMTDDITMCGLLRVSIQWLSVSSESLQCPQGSAVQSGTDQAALPNRPSPKIIFQKASLYGHVSENRMLGLNSGFQETNLAVWAESLAALLVWQQQQSLWFVCCHSTKHQHHTLLDNSL